MAIVLQVSKADAADLRLVQSCLVAGAGVSYGWCSRVLRLVHSCLTAGAGVSYGWCRRILRLVQAYLMAGAAIL